MVRCAIFAVGSELLEGSIVDTNSAWLGSRLVKAGFDVEQVRLIPDNKEMIVSVFRQALEEYDCVFTTGGLGPTFDDLTAETVAEAAGVETEMNETAKTHMINRLQERGVNIKDSHLRQAMLPKGCLLFPNGRGTALGFGMEKSGHIIISMPGVPYEMYLMFEEHVMPFLRERFEMRERHSIDIRIGSLPESEVDDVLREFGFPEGMECIINVAKGEILVKLRGFDEATLKEYAERVRGRFSDNFIGYGSDNIATALLRSLREKGLTLSVAESCTGGMIGKEITDIAGSSDVFMGGVISYSNDVKMRVLRVPENILINHGAVSEECARAMAVGVANQLRTSCSVAVTGVAGPGGGTDEKPVGTVCIGWCVGREVVTKKYNFAGDRDAIRIRSMKTALIELNNLLKKYTV